MINNMHDYLPRYYGDIPVATNIIDREADEMALLYASTYDVLAQFYVDTATWGLARWERIFGIMTDETKPLDQRRSVIISQFRRGAGTCTVATIKSIAESFSNGSVDVTEDNAIYTVTITFVSTLGIPPNLADLEAALRDALPAHLAVSYVFTYTTFGDIEDYNVTFGDIESAGLTFGQLETWGGP